MAQTLVEVHYNNTTKRVTKIIKHNDDANIGGIPLAAGEISITVPKSTYDAFSHSALASYLVGLGLVIS